MSTQVTPGLALLAKTHDFREVNFDVSDDSSVGEETEAKMRFPRSPYAKERLEDSGELGLDELLQGSAGFSPSITSSLTKTMNSLADSYRRLGKASEDAKVSIRESRRIDTNSVDADDQEFPSIDFGIDDGQVCRQVELASGNLSDYSELDASALYTTATTLSLDSTDDVDLHEKVPRMVITGRRRYAGESSDIKEIVVSGCVGVETSIILTFANYKETPQILCAKAVQMRFDDLKSHTQNTNLNCPMLTPGGANTSKSAFCVSPQKLRIDANSDASLHVRFNPSSVGIYSGVLKIRARKKSFVLLLRGESVEQNLPKALLESAKDVSSSQIGSTSISLVQHTADPKSRIGSNGKGAVDSLVNPENDPLRMRQIWMKDWLCRANQRGMAMVAMAPAISNIARHNGVIPTHSPVDEFSSAHLSVVPSSLRLLPQRKEKMGKFGVTLISTGLLHGNLLVRNFSCHQVDIVVSTSSESISVKPEKLTLVPYDAVSIVVEFDPSQYSSKHTHESPSSDGMHIGYVMITTGVGDQFVADIKMPPSSCLSPFTDGDQLQANVTLREFINCENNGAADCDSLCEDNDSVTLIDTAPPCPSDSSIVVSKENRITECVSVSSPQDEGLLQRKRDRAKMLRMGKENATARGKVLLAQSKLNKAIETKAHSQSSRNESKSVDEPVNTPMPQKSVPNSTTSGKLVKRMLNQNYSPSVASAAQALLSLAPKNDKPATQQLTAKVKEESENMTKSPLVVRKKTQAMAQSPNRSTVSSRNKMLRSPKRVNSPLLQHANSASVSMTKSSTAHKTGTPLVREKKTPLTKLSCNQSLIKARDEAVNRGIYFKRLFIDFGTIQVGSLTRQKIELCNSTTKDVTVHVKDPKLPFVTLHNEIIVKAQSYVRLPIRFVPVSKASFEVELVGQVKNSGECIKIILVGNSR